jgi:cobalamin biosynthesis protein CbiD
MIIVPNTRIFQEINGMTMCDVQKMAKRNVDITQEIWIRGYLECTENGL